MSGLLSALDTTLDNLDLGGVVTDLLGDISGLGDTVNGLDSGSASGIVDALGSPPTPEGLDGVTEISASLTGAVALIPGDTSGPLGPLLTPFASLSAGVDVSISITGVRAAFDAIRELVRLAGSRVASGASPMPEDDERGSLDLAAVRSTLGQAEGALDELVAFVDPSRLLELLAQLGPAGADLQTRWPALPVVGDMLQAFAAVGSWQTLAPAELQARLVTGVGNTATLLTLPRARVVDPALNAARTAARAGEIIGAASTAVTPTLRALGDRLAGGGRLSLEELDSLDAQLDSLEALCDALDDDATGLTTVEDLPNELEREFMRVLRLIEPALDKAALERRVSGVVDAIPAAPAELLGDLVTELEALDLSMITDPLSAVREAIETAVAAAEGALETVRDGLDDLLRPVSEGIEAAVGAIHLDQLQDALGELPGMIEGFVDDEIRTRLTSLKADIESVVDTVAGAVDDFDPGRLKARLEGLVREAASVLQNDQVREVFGTVQVVLEDILSALEGFPEDLRGASEESVALLDQIREVASAIDPGLIPGPVKPPLRQAVDAITDLDITGTVGEPLAEIVETALKEGALPVLEEFEALVDDLAARLEAFRPSSLISDDIEQPFLDLIETLRGFAPSQLLDAIADALADLRAQIHVVEPEELLGPLIELHAQLRGAVEQLDPEVLLAPVEEAIQAAIRSLMESSGFEDAFEGVQGFLQEVDDWVDVLEDCQGVLVHIADRLDRPADVEAEVDQLIAGVVASVGAVDIAALAEPLDRGKEAAEALDHRRIGAQLAPALLDAASRAPDALTSSVCRELIATIRALPHAAIAAMDTHAARTARRRTEALVRVADRLEAAVDPWHGLGPRLERAGRSLEADLRNYALLMEIEGRSVLADFLAPPADIAGLQDQLRDALAESVRLPVLFLQRLFAKLGPYAGGFARGLGDLLGALHGKVDAITGDEGLLGSVNALDQGLDLLRNFDLSPVVDPLRSNLYEPVLGVVDAVNPEPLRAVLQAVKDALEDLLDLANLFDRSTVETLDQTYAAALDKLTELSPRRVLVDAVDPVYEELLAEFLPVLDLPGRIREAVERSSEELPPEIVASLSRVEVAFDALLRALPLQPSGGSGPSVSVSASASASVSTT
ncbi:hypothetical protein PPSIR1_30255 [Plesiocystis pacifica SIR-1]|uniref:Uncharacterized protein n=1 Tax=Plesiocystis pacifica SIR-1 TaxID=391625 RepID=A6FZ30_9BACT|nr:hypothetical protein [Plesiocystis pacifica]EDM81185.1 hypothetical protein PPSIR1_30255 [Plesiocystis pacifica SIR-1]